MKLYTYYSHVPDHNHADELKMLLLWCDHHRRLGFEPICLQQYHCWRHPHYQKFTAAVGKLPSINPVGYDLACYERWMAVASQGGDHCIMLDYDTFLTPTVSDDLNLLAADVNTALPFVTVYQNTTPCIVSGTSKAFDLACVWFAKFDPAGREHVSDMIILEHIATKQPEAFRRFNYAKCYGEEHWKAAPAVHFSNSCMVPNKKTPRFKWIPELLKEHTMLTAS